MDSYDRSPVKKNDDDSSAPATTSANDGWGVPPADGDSAVPRYEPPHQRRQSRSPYPDRRDNDYVPPRRERSPPPPKPAAYANQVIPRSEVLGVFGLSIRTTEGALHDEFSRYGRVQKVVIVYDARSDRSRGFGFITMSSEDEAEECIKQLNGLDLNGRKIRVDYSMTHKPHQPTPGEYRGEKRFDDARYPPRDYRPPPPRDYGRDRDYRGGGGGYSSGYGGGGYARDDFGRDRRDDFGRDSRPPPPRRDDYRDSRTGGAYDDYGRAPRRYDDRERYASDRPRSRSPYYSSSMDRPAPYTSSSSGWGDSTGRSRAYDDPYYDRPAPSSYRSRSPAPRGGDRDGRDAYSSSRRSPSPRRSERRYSPMRDDDRATSRGPREELDAPPKAADESAPAQRW